MDQPIPIAKLTPAQSIDLLDQAARKMEPSIARAFLDGLERVRGRMASRQLADLIAAGNVQGVMDLLSVEVVGDAFQEYQAAISVAVQTGAKVAADIQPNVTGISGREVRIVFDALNPRLATYAEQISSTRVREIGEDMRQVVRGVIRDGTVAGQNPITTARRVKESVGLTEKQESSVESYRRALENGQTDALERALRDKRFDGSVRRAVDGTKPLSKKQINKMVERYRQRFTQYRSRVIARTESIRSIQGAQHELIQSYIDEGRISPDQVIRSWIYTQDSRTRDEHRMIPSMNPDGRGHNEAFQTPLGPLMYPGDPDGSAENTIQCFTGETKVSGNIIAGSKARYSGDIIKLKTRGGASLSVTPNHSILTSVGFVPAGKLVKGDYLVNAGGGVNKSDGVFGEDEKNIPSSIAEIFGSLSDLYHTFRCRVVGVDFNGDADRFNGDVDIVVSHTVLRKSVWPNFLDSVKHDLLTPSNPAFSAMKYGGPLDPFVHAVNSSATSLVSCTDLLLDRIRVFLDTLPFDIFSIGLSSDADIVIKEVSSNNGPISSVILSDLINRLSGGVFFDDLVDVRKEHFSGHVYDLQSKEGLILAEGLVASNCRCTVFPRIISAELLNDPTFDRSRLVRRS